MVKSKYVLALVYIGLFLVPSILFAQKQKVQTGIDVLETTNFSQLKGKKIGLLTNPTGVNSKLRSTIDILHESDQIELLALFGPEHGVRGEMYAGDKVDGGVDPVTGLPIYSLYGSIKQPVAEMLSNLDAIVYDIQDIGCRSYTYISTMGRTMAVAAEHDLEFIVLDRPNPLGGKKVEGSLVEDGYYSFVSQFRIPYIYGLTCGELAILINEEGMLRDSLKCKLDVVAMKGWKRNMLYEDTGLPWVMTSPHIPTVESAYAYPITGIMGELGHFSIGVGYTLPFQTLGMVGVSAEDFSRAMNNLELEGVTFRPIYYKPFYGNSKGLLVGGVQVYFTDFHKARLTDIQFLAVEVMNDLYPELVKSEPLNPDRFEMFDKVTGSNYFRENFFKEYDFDAIRERWMRDEATFRKFSSRYYLYK